MSNLQKVLQDFEKAKNNVIKAIEQNVTLAGIHYQGEVIKNTPVKMGDLQDSIFTGDTKNVKGKITVEVGTNLEYAPYIEFGIQGKVFQYYKGLRPFKNGVGASMFRGTLEKEKKNIISIIRDGG